MGWEFSKIVYVFSRVLLGVFLFVLFISMSCFCFMCLFVSMIFLGDLTFRGSKLFTPGKPTKLQALESSRPDNREDMESFHFRLPGALLSCLPIMFVSCFFQDFSTYFGWVQW